uniref:Uncharacterized protein n=1 Tax=Cafeteria roenbergensis TaxID=33653 RepID=A0A7S0JS20_CAFRO
MFPLVRDFVKQLASADEASATWHDAFLDVAGLKEAPEDTGAAANDGEQLALPPATPAAKTPSRFAGAGDATPDLAASDLSSVRPGTASRGPPRRDGLTLFSPPVSTPFLRPARTPGHVSGYERGSLVRGDPLATPPASGRPAPGALTAADLDTSPTGSPAGEIASPGADAGDDDVAPSPELASPEMPTISCRAASLISALDGPGGEGLGEHRGAPSSAAATAAATAAAAAARPPRTMADAALSAGDSGLWGAASSMSDAEATDHRAGAGAGAGAELRGAAWRTQPASSSSSSSAGAALAGARSDDEEEDGLSAVDSSDDEDDLLAQLASPGPIGLSRHSLALVGPAAAAAAFAETQAAVESAGGAGAAAATAPAASATLASARAAPAAAGRSSTSKRPSVPPASSSSSSSSSLPATSAAGAATAAASIAPSRPDPGSVLDDSDDDIAPPPAIQLATTGLALPPALQPRPEFSVRSLPPQFQSGPDAAAVIAVWSVVGSPLDPSDPVASSAGEVSEALSRQGVCDVSPRRAESLLALLESEGFLRSFRDGDTRRWRAFSDEE